MTNYKPFFTFASGETVGNAQVFATHKEAKLSAASRFAVWTMPIGYCVRKTPDPVNYRFDDNQGDVRL